MSSIANLFCLGIFVELTFVPLSYFLSQLCAQNDSSQARRGAQGGDDILDISKLFFMEHCAGASYLGPYMHFFPLMNFS